MGGGQHLKKKNKKKGSNIGSCPQVPVFVSIFMQSYVNSDILSNFFFFSV